VGQAFGDRAWVVRPGLILGPRENVGRLPWWLHRIAKGGRVLAPGDPQVRLQILDARDLAVWLIDGAERGRTGCYSATGVEGGTTYGRWLADCVDVTGSKAELVWVADDVLLQHQVEPWSELPLWMLRTPDLPHVWDVDSSAAYAAGLRCRPVTDTVRDTWAWLRADGRLAPLAHDVPRVGIDPAKEQRILDAVS
jgi:2'-hydroxyisoflavone reductase